MTLQQKMLAKQSKKGFTLVELVVVIAILAILAAIAIPAVVGLIQNANNSQSDSNAATIDNACKTYYSGIVSGQITSANDKTGGAAPAAGTGTSGKQSAADGATVQQACVYSGCYTSLQTQIDGGTDFGYDADGNVYATATHTGLTGLTNSTTLGNMYN
ncbi:MAG: prepilin-type N-terminal cleavage/methylation domain-containing protein [Clostridia bacterium]|nr:prepilin-type N-terminal cleavage/methylation domain-containing protein [Clostridia bacterium]